MRAFNKGVHHGMLLLYPWAGFRGGMLRVLRVLRNDLPKGFTGSQESCYLSLSEQDGDDEQKSFSYNIDVDSALCGRAWASDNP